MRSGTHTQWENADESDTDSPTQTTLNTSESDRNGTVWNYSKRATGYANSHSLVITGRWQCTTTTGVTNAPVGTNSHERRAGDGS